MPSKQQEMQEMKQLCMRTRIWSRSQIKWCDEQIANYSFQCPNWVLQTPSEATQISDWFKASIKRIKYYKYFWICFHNRDKQGATKWVGKYNEKNGEMLNVLVFDKPTWMHGKRFWYHSESKPDTFTNADEDECVRIWAKHMKRDSENAEFLLNADCLELWWKKKTNK